MGVCSSSWGKAGTTPSVPSGHIGACADIAEGGGVMLERVSHELRIWTRCHAQLVLRGPLEGQIKTYPPPTKPPVT